MRRLRLACLLAPLAASAAAAPAAADAPKCSSLFPGGARAGETITVRANGTFKPWPVEVWVDRPGVSFEAQEEAGTFSVSVAPDATPGTYWVRLYNADGAETARPFLVGTLPEAIEADEPNNAAGQAQPIDPNGVVVNGRLQRPGDVDAYAVPLESGQAIVAAIEANARLASPMDAVLQVVSPDGFVIDQADDSPGLDPALAFTAPTSGTYLIRVFAFPAEPDSSIRFAGGDDYVYRLTVTSGGLVTAAHPSAITRGEAPPLSAIGWNLDPDRSPLRLAESPEGAASAWNPELAGTADVLVVDLPVALASSSEDGPIGLPSLICGRIGPDGLGDRIELRAEPGASVRLRVRARSFGSPLDPVIRVEDSAGKELAEADDQRRSPDPDVTVKAPEDGLLRVRVRDLHRRGDPRSVYRIEAAPAAPEAGLRLDADRVVLNAGKALSIPVTIDRRDGFNQPITLEAQGLPEGVACPPVVSEPEGDSSKKVTLELSGDAAPSWSGVIRIVGAAGEGRPPIPATADRIDGTPTESIWLTVIPSP